MGAKCAFVACYRWPQFLFTSVWQLISVSDIHLSIDPDLSAHSSVLHRSRFFFYFCISTLIVWHLMQKLRVDREIIKFIYLLKKIIFIAKQRRKDGQTLIFKTHT